MIPLMHERFDLDADLGDLDIESALAILNLTNLWMARRALRTRWYLRTLIQKGQAL